MRLGRTEKTHYEQEKVFMETLRGVGCTVGEYVGDGQGELESTLETIDTGPVDVDPVDGLFALLILLPPG